jgi:16S rRNA (cytosine1402-N4)-methyltransferase
MHIPVLLNEVIKYLDPKPNENFIDATFGEGGHSRAILGKTGPTGKILGIEKDEDLLKKFPISNFQFPNRLILVNDSYVNLRQIVEEYQFGPVNGILFDLGFSSWHLEESGRGFSFLRDEPLIMRYAHKIQNSELKIKNYLTAAEIVNNYGEKELADIFWKYGEERFSRRIARRIAEERKIKPIKTTFDLAEIIKKAAPRGYGRGRIHPATRVFQALRIAVNNELENLKIGLTQALEILAPGGRMVVISFHSLEDRIVKNFFREKKQESVLEILTKKPVVSQEEEIRQNPRSRRAKLRAATKI